jgi:hypothetical protein
MLWADIHKEKLLKGFIELIDQGKHLSLFVICTSYGNMITHFIRISEMWRISARHYIVTRLYYHLCVESMEPGFMGLSWNITAVTALDMSAVSMSTGDQTCLIRCEGRVNFFHSPPPPPFFRLRLGCVSRIWPPIPMCTQMCRRIYGKASAGKFLRNGEVEICWSIMTMRPVTPPRLQLLAA